MSLQRSGRAAVRSALVAGCALATVLAAAGPAAAAPDRRAGVFKVFFAGYVSSASWSDCGDLAEEDPGTVCSYAEVMAFYAQTREQAGSDVHVRDPWGGTVKTFESTCEVRDVEGEEGVERLCVPLTERFGRATDAEVDVDPQLDATSASATVPVQVVDFVAGTEQWGSVEVTADFVGSGERRPIAERWHSAGRDAMTLESTRGWERDCTATATFHGIEAPGDLMSCSTVRVHQAEIRVYPNAQGPVTTR